MLSAVALSSFSYAPVAPAVGTPTRAAVSMVEISFEQSPWGETSEISDKAGLEALATKLNPTVGFWDPLGIADDAMPETIGWFRHAEIKHGRVAMAAFVGYCVQANGICFPWALQKGGPMFADISAAGSPGDQWDALPLAGKLQIIAAIGIFE